LLVWSLGDVRGDAEQDCGVGGLDEGAVAGDAGEFGAGGGTVVGLAVGGSSELFVELDGGEGGLVDGWEG
jgi:hypothetical protein